MNNIQNINKAHHIILMNPPKSKKKSKEQKMKEVFIMKKTKGYK